MIKEMIENYEPFNVQEENDKLVMLKYLNTFDDCLSRENVFGHFTSSAFIVNQDFTKVLMAYHNIYKSYSFLGGHVDLDSNFLNVAIRETKEESSLENFQILDKNIFSLEILAVSSHFKNQKFVSSHSHLNVTYLFQANDKDFIKNKEDENSSVSWINISDISKVVNEEDMKVIYQKIIAKIKLKYLTNN